MLCFAFAYRLLLMALLRAGLIQKVNYLDELNTFQMAIGSIPSGYYSPQLNRDLIFCLLDASPMV